MAKELPYFRFTPQEWQNGDISLERYELRGFLIELCSYYWTNNCSITRAKLEKKYSNDKTLINELIELEIIEWNEPTDFIHINFLNEQFDVLSEQRKRRQNAGSKGGKQKSSNAKAKLKQNSSYKDNNKDNNNLIERWEHQNHEPLLMQLQIDPELMDKYIQEFKAKLIANGTEIKNNKEINNWWHNWLKLQPKNNFNYLTKEEKERRQVPVDKEYIHINGTYRLLKKDDKGYYVTNGREVQRL